MLVAVILCGRVQLSCIVRITRPDGAVKEHIKSGFVLYTASPHRGNTYLTHVKHKDEHVVGYE